MSDRTLSERREKLSASKRALLQKRLHGGHGDGPPKAKQEIPQRSESGPAPLSFAQKRLWLLDQIEPELTAYNLPLAVRIRGPLDVEALEQAIGEIVQRHDVLRTTFASEDGRPVQIIQPHLHVPLPVKDLADLPPGERERHAEEWASDEARRPFDLRQGPLLRAKLLRLDAEEHLFLLTMHHIVTDAWSLGVFTRELSAFYADHVGSAPASLPPLPIQYADYAAWQCRHVPHTRDDQLAYWKEQLAGVPVLDLPTDAPRPPAQSYQGAKESLHLPRELAEAARALGRREEVTPFMTLLTAFEVLMGRLSGQDDFAVGAPIAGRDRRKVEGLIGFFVNTLALRADLSGTPSFRQVLQRTRQTTTEAYARQEVPFEKIVEELQPERDLSRTPVFQVMFNHLRDIEDTRVAPELPGLSTERVPLRDAESKFDLTLYAIEEDEGIHLDVVYSTDLFEPARMTELLRQYRRVLEQVVEHPEKPVHQCSLVTGAARTVLPDPAQPLPAKWEGPLAERLAHQARQRPDHPAVTDGHTAWSYAELEARSNQVAHYLSAQEIGSGDVVAIYAHRSAPLVGAVLGVLKAGAAFLLLDPSYPPARLVDYLRRATPAGQLRVEAAGPLPDALEAFAASSCQCRLALPAREELAAYPEASPGIAVEPDDPAYVTFTSGSTGTPRGIVGTHRPLTHFMDWHARTFDLGASDRFSMLSGLAHDPLLRDLFAPLWTGATLCIPDAEALEDPGRLASWLKKEAITAAHLTPARGQFLTTALSQDATPTAPRLPALRYAFFSGDVLTEADAERLGRLAPSAQCVNFYGATETPQGVGYYVVPDALPPTGSEALPQATALPLGHGIEGVQLLVTSPGGREAGIGEVGEIHVRTPYLAQGYLGEPERTRARFLNEKDTPASAIRRYRTGDRGRYRPDGTVAFAGRTDRQVKIRGYRIEPGEVEAALGRHPQVQACAVRAWGEAPAHRHLAAYVVTPAGEETTPEALRAYLKQRLPAHMVPPVFVPLKALPLTPNGKLDRAALPPPEPRRPVAEAAPPRTSEEQTLTEICRTVLELDYLGIEENLFAAGLNSLLVVQVSARAQAAGLEIRPRQFFEHQTVAALAAAARRTAAQHAGLTEGAAQERERLAEMNGAKANGARTNGACADRASVVAICPEDAEPPLFSVGVFKFQKLAPYWQSSHPLYGLLRQDLDLIDIYAHRRMENLAADYVAAMRRRQPEGPYHLMGFCFGGLVAYEMAHQLRAAGQDVARLIMIDAHSPQAERQARSEDSGQAESRWAFHLRRLFEQGPAHLREWAHQRANFEVGRWTQELREWVVQAYRLAGQKAPLRLHKAFTRKADAETAAQYRPKAYPGAITLLRGKDSNHLRFIENGEPDPMNGWDELVKGGVRVIEVPGHHTEMFEEPHVRTLVRRLEECLETPADSPDEVTQAGLSKVSST